MDEEGGKQIEAAQEGPMVQPKDLSLLQSVLTIDFWLLFFVCTVGERPARLCMHIALCAACT